MTASFAVAAVAITTLCLTLLGGAVVGVRDSRSPWFPVLGMGAGASLLVLGFLMAG